MRIMRAAGCRKLVATIVGTGETVGLRKIDPEASAGPEIGSVDGVVDDDVPPIETPQYGALRLLLAGLSDDALGILDDLVRTDRAVYRILGFLDIDEGGLECEKCCECDHGHDHGGE